MKKILIVEDDKKSLYLARFILQKEGYEVVEAGDGLEALDKISSETPDLILMDMQLPKLDGYEATRRIKANEKSIKIPVIALTAYAMKGDREKIIEAGCSGYIEKPIDPATFAEEVKKFIRGTGIMKILIVDDNEQNLYMLQVLLKARGYEVVSAANGAEALEKARRDPPDMIISDILMPVMDGFTLCREWKGDERLNEIPFIFYTATYSDPKDEELALSLGAERLIVKPVEPDEFIRILQNIIIDVEKGQVKPLKPVLEEDKKGFKLYSERLVKKLEKKMVDLEKEITKRKQVEEEIKSNEVRFRELFKNMNSGVAIYEAKDNGNDFIFKDFNPAAERIEKIKKEDLIDKSVLEVFPWVKEFGLFDVFKRVWETGEPEHHPITLYKDKRVVGWRENYAYKLPSGEIVAVYDDVTERKRTVEALRQSQKMEAIGTLAGGIAHDFNNILGSIIGYTEIANLQATEGDTVEESLKEILKAGLRATDLVKQILAFSRKGEQKRIPVQISNIVKEALKLLRSSLPTTIEIHQTIESDTGIVEADPTQIHQVLMNLCTNAGHAMREEGGVLEVGIRNVGVVSRDSESEYLDMTSGPYLLLTVSDTGKA